MLAQRSSSTTSILFLMSSVWRVSSEAVESGAAERRLASTAPSTGSGFIALELTWEVEVELELELELELALKLEALSKRLVF